MEENENLPEPLHVSNKGSGGSYVKGSPRFGSVVLDLCVQSGHVPSPFQPP